MMRFIFKVLSAAALCSPIMGFAQGVRAFPLESRRCDSLPDHQSVQECQKLGQAQSKEWQKQMEERYAPGSFRLNRAETKPPINCFKRESTGEQVCAN
jgi:hypothetical protein